METQDPEVILARMQTRHDRMFDELDRLKEKLVLLQNLILRQAGELDSLRQQLTSDTEPSLGNRVMTLGAKERKRGTA